MPAVIVLPIVASSGHEACLQGEWQKGRWEVYEPINNAVELLKEELAPGFQFIFSDNNRQHSIQKDFENTQGFSAFELIQPPKCLDWMPATLVLHVESDSVLSATNLNEISRLRKAGRHQLLQYGIAIDRIPSTARAIVFTTDRNSVTISNNVLVDLVDIFALRSWVTESCVIASLQETAANMAIDGIDVENLTWSMRRKFVKRFELVLMHIWWEHVLSKEGSRNIFETLRSRNGIVGRYAQLAEIAETFSNGLRIREQRITNVLLGLVGLFGVVLPLLTK